MITSITLKDWLILIGLALSGLLAFTLVIHALKLMSANLVSAFWTLELVLAICAQAVLYGEIPDSWSFAGSSFVLIGALSLTFEEHISGLFSSCSNERQTSMYTSLEKAQE